MPFSHGAAGASSPDAYEWRPYSRHPLVTGRGYGIELARLMLHEMRWRERPRQWLLRIVAGFVVLLLHLAALAMMALVRPAGMGPGPGTGGSGVVSVRLIDEPAAAPAPPPVALPTRPAIPVAPAVKAAATPARAAALPPVPVPSTQPRLVPTPAKPRVAVTPPHVRPVPAQVIAQAPEAPPIMLPPLRVVAEPSRMAIPVPPTQPVQVLPVPSVVPSLEPVPIERRAPRIAVTAPPLKINAVAAAPAQPVAPAPVEAARLPPVPNATPPPTVPVPLARAPIAQVSRPMPSIRPVVPPAIVAVAPPASSGATAAADRHAAQAAPASSSWALGNDQFKPATGAARQSGTLAARGPQREGTVELVPRGNSDVMTRRTDHLGYKATIFEQDWAPANESVLDTFLRHFIEKLTVKHTFHVAPGIRVHCVLGPIALFLACGGDPPRPRPAKSDDPRLNMAPARQLVPRLPSPAMTRPAPAPNLRLDNRVQCQVAKVAGSPPPPGCPGGPPAAASSVGR